LKRGLLRNGDRVLINIGEGIRRAPEFLITMFQEKAEVATVDACRLFDRRGHRADIWNELEKRVMNGKTAPASRRGR